MSRSPARLFVDADLSSDSLALDERTAHYVGHVLRLGAGDAIVVFDGRGNERHASIERLSRRSSTVVLGNRIDPLPPAAFAITLLQGIIKPDRMDLVVQKATELGVRRVVAVRNEFSAVKLAAERIETKRAHWLRVAASACEQSGRHDVPEIAYARSLGEAVGERPADEPLVAMHNDAAFGSTLLPAAAAGVTLIVGPEGGFSGPELELLDSRGTLFLRLGDRVLRAETAAIVACTLAQLRWGDFSRSAARLANVS